jgi:Arc/MetJ-type ribon-helix-helix transcriptional regulator
MVSGMATKKLTITLDEQDLARIRALVAEGKASTISGFVQHAIGIALQDAAGWGIMLADALAQTGGPLSKEERQWADRVLDASARAGRSRRRRAA